MISISANLNIMIKAVEKASKSIIRDFGEIEKLQVSKKGPRDFVTKTDRHVEKILIEELSNTKKNYSFITEETGTIKNKDKENIWIIDPIDGTTNFLHGIPHFAICIAHQSKNEILSGLIFDPIKDEMFFAEKDKGAFLNNQRLRVSKKNSLDDCLFSSNHEGLKYSNLNMRCSGSAALDLA
jgi:myo-inositol-1(or 4)-monophosphatase